MKVPEWVSEMLQQMAAESTGTAAPIHLQGEPMAIAPAPNLDAVPGHNWWVNTSNAHGRTDQWAECECGWRGTTHRVTVNGTAMVSRPPAHADGLAHAAQFRAPLWCQSKLLTADGEWNCAERSGHDGSHCSSGGRTWTDDAVVGVTLDADWVWGSPLTDPAVALEHLRVYQAKRVEWLQAKHDADVADRALDVQRAKAIEARRAMRLAEAVADKAAQHRDEQRAIAENLDGELWALVKGEQA